ncbi:hypothetical protein AVP_35 [Aerococcus phage vB_AviM_AVP]|nr:hypothetical protein AVP_35 [Aerococcus phage vB_AviM_AVP]
MKFKNIIGTVVVLGCVIVIGLFGWSYSNNEGDGSTMYQPSDNVTVNTTKREEIQSEPESVEDYKERLPESETVGSESDVDPGELNYAVSQEVFEGQDYQDLGYSEYGWLKYVDSLYVTDNMVIVINATQELEYLDKYHKVEAINEIQKVVDVLHFELSDKDIYGNLPVAVYNNKGELIADSSFETPRRIELY